MAVFLSHMTAADFWRLVYRPDRAPGSAEAIVPFEAAESSLRSIKDNAPSWLFEKVTVPEKGLVHTLVPKMQARARGQHVRCRMWGMKLPEGSFYKHSDGLYIASPPFVFLQFASMYSLPEVVAYGNEICGRYVFDKTKERGIGKRLNPVCSVERIARFLDLARGARGYEKARRALEHVHDGAESPMETVCLELLGLPLKYGGYGIGDLQANVEIPLTEAARKIALRKSCRADILIDSAKTDIEFLGKHDHEGDGLMDRDRRRSNALSLLGYEVVELTNEQVTDFAAFEEIALGIAKRMGKFIEPANRGATPSRASLRSCLFRWNANSGRPNKKLD